YYYENTHTTSTPVPNPAGAGCGEVEYRQITPTSRKPKGRITASRKTPLTSARVRDITLGVALGSATQIAVFVVPLSVIVAWIIGVDMDLDFSLLETGSLTLAILVTAFTLQSNLYKHLETVGPFLTDF
ncbi:hypothetical protein Tco_0914367, partial [Tanacetum coccineum]